jgi:hypothetical protein
VKKITERMPRLTKKSVKQLLASIPQHLLEEIGQETKVDYNVSRLYGERMFKLIVFAMLRSETPSTRLLEHLYNTPYFSAFIGKGGHKTRHSSIADRISNMNPEYFKAIFEWAVEHYGKMLNNNSVFKRLKRFDSTMVTISSALVDWGMRVGKPPQKGPRKVQLKFTMELHAKLPASVKSFFHQDRLSEERALKQAIEEAKLEEGDIAIFDNGLKSRQTLIGFDNQGIKFVTRGIAKTRYETQQTHSRIKGRQADGLKFIRDEKVYLYGNAFDLIEHPFRLIEVEILDKAERLIFITNIWDLNAMQLARIYRQRWDIEVFFRFLKQQLGIKHLINRSENGVQIQIYCALIAAILLLVFKITNKISGYKTAKLLFAEQLFILFVNELNAKNPP